jgi:carbon-monoxide dehydrogenase iron sulfur subunit
LDYKPWSLEEKRMKEIFVRIDHCVGCHSCELACAVEHSKSKNLFAAIAEKPVPRKRLYVEYIEEEEIPVLCRHCEDAPCVRICHTGALDQDAASGVVTHNPDRCVGCWMCTMVCPFGVIGRQKERRIAIKCDRCPDLDVPACVNACPVGALVFDEEDIFSAVRRIDAAFRIASGYLASQSD